MAEAPQFYTKVGRHGERAVEAFNLWAASAKADYRYRGGASLETIRESIIDLAITVPQGPGPRATIMRPAADGDCAAIAKTQAGTGQALDKGPAAWRRYI